MACCRGNWPCASCAPIRFLSLVSILNLLALQQLPAVQAQAVPTFKQQNLSGRQWKLQNSNGTVVVQNATVPGYVLSTLHKTGRVPDPLYKWNEQDLKWVAMDSWTYSLIFDVDPIILNHTNVDLILQGVDLSAEITLNGFVVGTVANAFREYGFAVGQWLKPGSNLITVQLASAVTFATDQAANIQDTLPYIPATRNGFGQLPGYNFVRKAAVDFGWYMTPALAPQGIPGAVLLRGYYAAYIASVQFRQEFLDDIIDAHVVVQLQVPSTPVAMLQSAEDSAVEVGTVTVTMPELGVMTKVPVQLLSNRVQVVNVTISLNSSAVNLWWPHGLGQPNLYTLKVEYQADGHTPSPAVAQRIGFRSVELNQDPVDGLNRTNGELFYFTVNGAPVFIKGSSVLPINAIRSDISVGQVKQLVASAVASNMNMLRVWGGGNTMPDLFYQLCDQQGILVWQDLFFASAPYPTSDDFVLNVLNEVQQVARRLGSHPSLALWSGNTDVEGAIARLGSSPDVVEQLRQDYISLFIDNISVLFSVLDPERPYWDGTPSKGFWDPELTAKRWDMLNDPRFGDDRSVQALDDMFGDCQDPSTVRTPRFMSEWGALSPTSWNTIKYATDSDDWRTLSDMSYFRARMPLGVQRILDGVTANFGTPASWNTSNLDIDTQLYQSWIYLAQVNQAVCVSTSLTRWKTLSADPQICTMGSLMWHMNDVWQATSWSTTNYDGSWKPAQYVAARAYAPVGLHVQEINGTLEVYASNDALVPVQVKLLRQAHDWSDVGCPDSARMPLGVMTLPPLSVVLMWSESMGAAPAPVATTAIMSGLDTSDVEGSSLLVHFALQYNTAELAVQPDPLQIPNTPICQRPEAPPPLLTDPIQAGFATDKEIVAFWHRSRLNELTFAPPELELANFVQVDSGNITFTVTSRSPAAWVWLETPYPGRFSENAFTVHPCYPVTVTFTAATASGVKVEDFVGLVNATSLFDHQLGQPLNASTATGPQVTKVAFIPETKNFNVSLSSPPSDLTLPSLINTLLASYTLKAAINNNTLWYHLGSITSNSSAIQNVNARLPTNTTSTLSNPFSVTKLLRDVMMAYQEELPIINPLPTAPPPPPLAPNTTVNETNTTGLPITPPVYLPSPITDAQPPTYPGPVHSRPPVLPHSPPSPGLSEVPPSRPPGTNTTETPPAHNTTGAPPVASSPPPKESTLPASPTVIASPAPILTSTPSPSPSPSPKAQNSSPSIPNLNSILVLNPTTLDPLDPTKLSNSTNILLASNAVLMRASLLFHALLSAVTALSLLAATWC